MRRSSGDIRHFIIAGVLVVVVAVLLYLALRAALPLPLQASSQSLDIDWLFQAHMMLLSLLFALVIVFMLYAFVAFRRRKGDTDETEGDHFEGNTALEIAWTVLPLVAVVIFGYLGVQSLRNITAEQPGEMTIQAEGFQWAWAFSYPDTGVQSAELVMPVNQPILMELSSRDVIHAFWVPEFRVKKDLVPGQTTELRITPIEEGEFTLMCAEICGLTHYNMLAKVRVVSEDEFAMWMGEQVVEQGLEVASKQPATN